MPLLCSSRVHVVLVFTIICLMVEGGLAYGVVSVPHPFILGVDTVRHDRNETFLEDTDNFDENTVNLPMDTRVDMTFLLAISCKFASEITVDVTTTEHLSVLKIEGESKRNFICENSDIDDELVNGDDDDIPSRRVIIIRKEIMVTLHSGNIGVSSVMFEVFDLETKYDSGIETVLYENSSAAAVGRSIVKIEVIVTRDMHLVDIIFIVTVYAIEIIEMLTFGTQLDFDVVTRTLKKPAPLLIGLCCQYIGMPLIAFAIARVVASDSVTAIGIFVAGICPGGGSSNIYSYLLDGDLSLSITMTTVSTIMSLGMIPLWLYTLGGIFLQAHELSIPYTDITVTLSVIIVPLSCGLLIRNKLPKIVDVVEKVMSVVITIAALVLIVTGVISSLYLINLFNLKIILVGCCLPYVGFLLGAFGVFIFKQSFSNVKTIAIETGLQNTAIAMILLQNSFPPPFGDLATVAPVSAEVMSPIPPFVTSVVYLIHKKWCKKYKHVEMKKSTEIAENQMGSEEFDTDNECSI